MKNKLKPWAKTECNKCGIVMDTFKSIREHSCKPEKYGSRSVSNEYRGKITMIYEKTDKLEKEFFNQLADKLEEFFEKGELCKCGKRLPCRSKALAFNAFANLIFRNLIKSQKELSYKQGVKETLDKIELKKRKDFCRYCADPIVGYVENKNYMCCSRCSTNNQAY